MSKMYDLAILCGGKGSRLGKITKKTPKPLIKFRNIEFLQHLLNFYAASPYIEKIFLLTGYKSDQFNKFHNKYVNLKKIICLSEKKPLGTLGALSILKKKINKSFLVINGDSFIQFDLTSFLKAKGQNKILLCKNQNYRSNKKLANLGIDNNNLIFFKKKKNINLNYMNAGVYLFSPNIFLKIKKKFSSLEDQLIPNIIELNKLYGYKTFGKFIDIGLKKNLIHLKKNFKDFFERPAIFLDRDGVINDNLGYVYTKRRFKVNAKLLSYLSKKYKSYYKFIVTNQSGIGRGYYSTQKFIKFQNWTNKYLYEKFDLLINDTKYCPHHSLHGKGKFKKKCLCRKPNNLMLRKLIRQWPINLKKSFFIGDSLSDLKCSKKTKINFYYPDSIFNLKEQ